MKAIGIIGYKKSGKTSLLVNLARELTARGHTVSSAKHTSGKLDLPGTDTSRHRDFARQTIAIAADESAIFFNDSKNLEDLLSFINADFILIEGFKKKNTYPKIICLRPDDDPETLMDGLEICIVGTSIETKKVNFVFDPQNDISKIADLVEEKAFKLPGLDCKACGFKTCHEMGIQIVNGNKTIDDCVSLNADVQIKINDQIMSLNPFVSNLLKNTIIGMLSSLKGYQKGKIGIRI